MFAAAVPRSTVRRIALWGPCGVRASLSSPAAVRSRLHSTKHPQGFAPPTDDDLTELRERVQEFTR